jgi:hypothetical protein
MTGSFSPWGGADGTNGWDKNNVGNPFYSGTLTGVSGNTVTINGAGWIPNQWQGYTLKRNAGGFSYIQNNTSNTITFANDLFGGHPPYAVGNVISINKVHQSMDQAGAGQSTLISGNNPTPPPGFNQIAEPCYIWNNTNDGSPFNSFDPETANIQQGIHYFNNTILPGYTPYTYPHPLVIGSPTPRPSSPVADPATFVASHSFRANWRSVSGATGYRLDVATNNSFNNYVAGYQNLNVGNALSRSVPGLNVSTTYYYRVRAYNGSGTSGNSNIVHVTTLTPTGPPVAITNPATSVTSSSATLNGSLNPHGLITTLHFRYGTTTSYGLTTAPQSRSGNTYTNVSANIRNLSPNTVYHFRIVATNAAGTRFGSDRTFRTP